MDLVTTTKTDGKYYIQGKFYKVEKGQVYCGKDVLEFFTGKAKAPVKEEDNKTQKQETSHIDWLRNDYMEKHGKEVPVNKKNDIEWIKSKL